MFRSFDCHAGAEHSTEDLQLGAAETLAGGCRGADRAVILQQQEPIRILLEFRHVALARADLAQPRQFARERRGTDQRLPIGLQCFDFAHPDQPLQRDFAQFGAHRVDQPQCQFGVGVGKARVPSLGQAPNLRWTTDAAALGIRDQQPVGGESGYLLARRLGGDAKGRGKIRDTLRATALDHPEQPIAGIRGIIQVHAWIIQRRDAGCKTPSHYQPPAYRLSPYR